MSNKDTSQIWVEKYRPQTICAITHQTQVISTLQRAIHQSAGRGDLPHLLFYGPPGTGKTSTALALVRDLFGPTLFRSRLLELNASDERGINVVRDKIKTFAQTSVSATGGATAKYPCPPFKVVVLDEADAITTDAQTALRRTMEQFSTVTRFVLICNYVTRIIAPLTSRCAKFRFSAVPMEAMLGHLRRIVRAEGVDVVDDTLRSVIGASEGDLRRAINTLQSAHRMRKKGAVLDMDTIAAAACLVPMALVDEFDEKCCAEGLTNVAVRRVVDAIVMEGFSVTQLLSQYGDLLLEGRGKVGSLNDLQKGAVAVLLAEAEKALNDGCDELLQLYHVASQIHRVAAMGEELDSLMAITVQT